MLCEFLSFYGGNELTFRYSILVVGEQKVLKRRILLTLHFLYISKVATVLLLLYSFIYMIIRLGLIFKKCLWGNTLSSSESWYSDVMKYSS